jgi:enoyl-CoA hydratase
MNQHHDLLVDRPATGVTRLTLNRPETLNALTMDLVGRLNSTLDAIAQDGACRVVILQGEGRGFCSGQDMAVADESNAADPGVVEKLRWQHAFAGMVQRLRRLPQPVIAAVNGAAAGAGMGLALAADVRIVSTTAKFHVAAVRIGLTAGECGISYHLPRIIGAGRAFSVLLSGRPIGAAEAEQIGLAARVVAPDDLADAALEDARALLANSPFSIAQTKRLMWANLEAGSLDQALELENAAQILATGTRDYAEATRAFVEKRPPQFTGL